MVYSFIHHIHCDHYSTLQHVHFNNLIDKCFYYVIILYNNKIINLYFKCGDPSASLLPFYIIVALPDNGRNYRPKHVVVNEMNK